MPHPSQAFNVFDEMGSCWEEIADNHYTEQQISFLQSRLKREHYVLDLACGTGRHTIPLQKEGYKIVGLDASVNLQRIGKQRSARAVLICGDMRFLPFSEATFSAAISMDTSIGYLPSNKEDQESFVEVRRVLKRNALFIVDVFNRINLFAKYQNKASETKVLEYPSFYLQQKREVTNNGTWLCDSWTTREKADGQVRVFKHAVRLFDIKQLRVLLESTGFAVKQVFGDYEGRDLSNDSSRIIVVATAQKR